ncbi:MAG: hypothetical protein KME30_02875 [Iphinoe sp. HA4291-MV1]|jgi:DNA polymerase III gamma/tau subunit|nr:hypothetical protein [Iphinoe sp. HA4291-MV1]
MDEHDKRLLGGYYRAIKKANQRRGGEVNHIPPKSAYKGIIPLNESKGSAIWMEKADHRKTASWGNSKEARVYRAIQKELISQNKFREALKMDINDICSKFGNKYDQAIKQALKYVDKIEKNGKTKPDVFQTKEINNHHELEKTKNNVDKLKLAKKLTDNLKKQEYTKINKSEKISKSNYQKLKELSQKPKEQPRQRKENNAGKNRHLAQQIREPCATYSAKPSEIKSKLKETFIQGKKTNEKSEGKLTQNKGEPPKNSPSPDKNTSEKNEEKLTQNKGKPPKDSPSPDKNTSEKNEEKLTQNKGKPPKDSPQSKETRNNVNESKNKKIADQMKDSSATHAQKPTEARSAPKETSTNQKRKI